ncbi:MAG: TMEM165/GDT1 family protein [Candidatus Thermoplasmatota archaeon]
MKIVPDTSVIVDGRVTSHVGQDVELAEIIVSEAVVAELEAQANKGQEIGMSGLEEIRELKRLDDDGKVKLIFKGERPTLDQIKLSPGGEIDHLVRELASKEKGTLLTSDLLQSEIASTKGIKVEYLKKGEKKVEELKILDFFGEDVMSVHLRENIKPKVKAGTPGDIELRTLDRDIQTEEELRTIAREIIETSKRSPDGLAIAAGTWITKIIPSQYLKIISGIIFIIFGIFMLINTKGEEEEETKKFKNPFITSFFLILLMEFGDKTQIAAALFATNYNPYMVLTGTIAALFILSCIAIFFGKIISEKIPRNIVNKIAAIIFIIMGITFFII